MSQLLHHLPPAPRWAPSAGRVLAVLVLVAAFLVCATVPGGQVVTSSRPVWGFLPTWDQNALTSFRHHAAQMSAVLPSGLVLDATGHVTGGTPADLTALAHARGVAVFPVVANYAGGWQSAGADRMLRTPALRARAVAGLAAGAAANGWNGVNVDLESLPARDRQALPRFISALRGALGSSRQVSVDVPATPSRAFDLPALGQVANSVVVMAYDEHSSPGAPGPIAGARWVAGVGERSIAAVPAARLVIGLPTYSYRWHRHGAPTPLDYGAALTSARRAGVLPAWSAARAAPTFTTGRGAGATTTWMSDAVSLAAQLRALPGPTTPIALWHLGAEDPGVWDLLARSRVPDAPNRFAPTNPAQTIPPSPQVQVVGTGDVVNAVEGRPGWRIIDPLWRSERYLALPRRWRLERWGGGPRQVALTFDDGPDPMWTPQVLAALRRLHAPAAFFLVGRNAASYPGLVRQEMADGFAIGGHTFSHPNLATISDTQIRLQLMGTTRVIGGITGHDPLMFRAPYAADTAPSAPGEVRPLLVAQGLGMTEVGASVDSQDYLRPGVPAIVRNVLGGLRSGDIILVHDAGGDRSQTVQALPAVVRALRAHGYSIVPVSTLVGTSQRALMPPIHGLNLWLSRFVAWVAIAWFWLVRWIAVLGIVLLVLLSARAIAQIILALVHRYRPRPRPRGPLPPVTVVVPAYNEGEVIARTIESLHAQRGVQVEVLVLDDGSIDDTADVARAAGARVVTQANQGKWAALNRGFAAARDEYVVAIDADTILHPDAVARVVRPLLAGDVGAVAGTVKVGNRHTLVTQWQHIEYVTGFNIDRRAQSLMNAVMVIPGAIGAWRRSAVVDAGGYSGRSLAEDCDLTVRLRRAGWRIEFVDDAVAWTEAPETVHALMKQRLRWTFGTLQVLWANRSALFRPSEGFLGWVTLPFAWLYQVVLSTIAPVIDLLVIIAALTGGFPVVLKWFLIATALEMLCAWLAFRMEGEKAWPVLALPVARFAYRQMMYITVMRALFAAARGRRMGWGRLVRTGSVQAESARPTT